MLRKLFGVKEDREDEYVEIDVKEDREDRFVIQVERLQSMNDSDRILNKLRAGGIMLVKVKELREKDDTEYKRAMEKIKKITANVSGEIGGLGSDWILLTPSFAKIHRSVE